MISLTKSILKAIGPFIRVPVVGFDISDRTVKYLQLSPYGKLDFNFFGEFTIPEGIIVNGEILQEEKLVEVLKEWLDRDGRSIRSSAVTMSLPEEKSFLRVVQLPTIQKSEISKAIRWEIESNIPLPVDQLAYDYEIVEPLEDHLDHIDVLLVAFPKNVVESYTRIIMKCGFHPLALEHESQAIVRAIIGDLRERRTSIIVDMGRTRTSFIIFAGGSIRFTTTIELGGWIFENNIMKELGVNGEEALAIKKEVGLDRRKYDGKLFSVLAPPISVLADELKRAIRYYVNHPMHRHGANQEIDVVILIGGDANLHGLDTYLASALKIPVVRGNPLNQLQEAYRGSSIPPLSHAELITYTTVIGLALRKDL